MLELRIHVGDWEMEKSEELRRMVEFVHASVVRSVAGVVAGADSHTEHLTGYCTAARELYPDSHQKEVADNRLIENTDCDTTLDTRITDILNDRVFEVVTNGICTDLKPCYNLFEMFIVQIQNLLIS